VAAAAAAAVLAGCGGDGGPAPAPAATTAADPVARVTAHLLAHGARRAARGHPEGYWFAGSLVLPAGGGTCAVASITAGAHGPLVTDVVFDRSGTVSVRVRASPAQRPRCMAAAREALRGFDAAGG
jgi:hypothetical protein